MTLPLEFTMLSPTALKVYHQFELVDQIYKLADLPEDWISMDLSLYYQLFKVLVYLSKKNCIEDELVFVERTKFLPFTLMALPLHICETM